jgi:hypothetical protein
MIKFAYKHLCSTLGGEHARFWLYGMMWDAAQTYRMNRDEPGCECAADRALRLWTDLTVFAHEEVGLDSSEIPALEGEGR